MFKAIRRKIKNKVPKSLKDYFFSIQQIPKRFSNYKIVCENLKNSKTLEIGGPSSMFYTKLPIYQKIKSLDVVNFSNKTTWEGAIKEGYTCNYYRNKFAYQHISEAADLEKINNDSYDAIISSHCLEHVANPIKALMRWKNVLSSNGIMLLVLPNKIGNFDHKRKDTTIEHLILDCENNTNENDTTHFEESIQLYDLDRRPGEKIALNTHINIVNDNFNNREVHHHVFSKKLIFETMKFCGFEIINYLENNEDLITLCKKKIIKIQ